MSLEIGSRLGPYEIVERLGAGGMGEVYRAQDSRLERDVAIKLIAPAAQRDPGSRDRLLREARAASALRSPYIAVTHDIGEHEGSLFIVMEYVDGKLLSEHVVSGPLPVPQVLKIGSHVGEALEEAHTHGIVHRDIKSANVMLTARGLVKVLDFGLAKFMAGSASAGQLSTTRLAETATGVVLGTISYMSPEQVLGRAVDHRSDLFSLGVVLYELLTARLPFEGNSITEVADRILHQPPAALARFNYEVTPELEAIVRKALEKNPDFRYQSARELRIDLQNLRRRIETRSVVTQAGGVAEYASVASHDVAEPQLENAVAVMTFVNITSEPKDDWIGTGIAETVTADLKNIQGLSVIGRVQIFDVLKNLSGAIAANFEERAAIELGRRLRASWIVGGGYQRLGDLSGSPHIWSM